MYTKVSHRQAFAFFFDWVRSRDQITHQQVDFCPHQFFIHHYLPPSRQDTNAATTTQQKDREGQKKAKGGCTRYARCIFYIFFYYWLLTLPSTSLPLPTCPQLHWYVPNFPDTSPTLPTCPLTRWTEKMHLYGMFFCLVSPLPTTPPCHISTWQWGILTTPTPPLCWNTREGASMPSRSPPSHVLMWQWAFQSTPPLHHVPSPPNMPPTTTGLRQASPPTHSTCHTWKMRHTSHFSWLAYPPYSTTPNQPHQPLDPTFPVCRLFWLAPLPFHSADSPPLENQKHTPMGTRTTAPMGCGSGVSSSSLIPHPFLHLPFWVDSTWNCSELYCQGFTLADDSRHYFFILAISSIFTSVSNSPLLQFLLKFWLQNTFFPFAKLKYYLAPVRHCFSLRNDWENHNATPRTSTEIDFCPPSSPQSQSLDNFLDFADRRHASWETKKVWFLVWPSSICNHHNPPTQRLSRIHLSILLSSLLLLLVAGINICSINHNPNIK